MQKYRVKGLVVDSIPEPRKRRWWEWLLIFPIGGMAYFILLAVFLAAVNS